MGDMDGNNRAEMEAYIKIIKAAKIKIKNLVEIGSMTGQDAARLANEFDIRPENVHIIEAHCGFYREIKRNHPEFNVYNFAANNYDGVTAFNQALNADDGRSSILPRPEIYNETFSCVDIPCIKMETFLVNNNIDNIDLLKIDVEGASMEVLEGFGKKIKKIRSLQIEAEIPVIWEGQRTFGDIKDFLEKAGFKMEWVTKVGSTQVDSVWLNHNL